MKARLNPTLVLVVMVLLLSGGSIRAQNNIGTAALGTAFTYQGRLSDGGTPANGTYDLRFILYDAEIGGSQVGNVIIEKDNVTVTDGLFTVYLDFGGNVFTGSPRYLDIGVRPGSSTGGYTPLSSRQLLSPTPYAIYSASTGALQGQAVSAGAPLAGQVLKWDGAQWVASSTDHDHYGASWTGSAVRGLSVATSANADTATALYGQQGGSSGVAGGPAGVWGDSSSGYGVVGTTNTTFVPGRGGIAGVWGDNGGDGTGVKGTSNTGDGVLGVSNGQFHAGVSGVNEGGGEGVYAQGNGSTRDGAALIVHNFQADGGMAAYLTNTSQFATAHFANAGNGEVLYLQNNGGPFIRAVNNAENDLKFVVYSNGNTYTDGCFCAGPADFAEMIPAVAGLEAGDVLVINPSGMLDRSNQANQTSVVGIYSTNPGFVAGHAAPDDSAGKVPLAVVGVVPAKVTAQNGPIHPGNLLVTSSIPGRAMLAGAHPLVGTVIGKALGTLTHGDGVIQVLVLLQ